MERLRSWTGPAVLVAVWAMAWTVARASGMDAIWLCPVRACTGVSCPGCGMIRSVGRMLRGDLAGSLQLHPAGIVLAIEAIVVIGLMAGLVLRGKSRNLARWAVPLAVANGVLLMSIWAVRLAAGTLPV
jgi:hypothetical protein